MALRIYDWNHMSETEETQTSINDLEKWIESNGPKLFLFAQQQTGSHADAQDVYQDALVKVLKETMQSGGSQVPPVGRMFLAIKHRAIDLHRQRSSRTHGNCVMVRSHRNPTGLFPNWRKLNITISCNRPCGHCPPNNRRS